MGLRRGLVDGPYPTAETAGIGPILVLNRDKFDMNIFWLLSKADEGAVAI
jgi:hypothetical protein